MKKVYLSLVAVLGLICAVLYVPVLWDDVSTARNRRRVHELVAVGQQMEVAQTVLRGHGFRLMYEEPIDPTRRNEFRVQNVIVGDLKPRMTETIAYAAELRWIPFTRSEPPYVVIWADLKGRITKVE